MELVLLTKRTKNKELYEPFVLIAPKKTEFCEFPERGKFPGKKQAQTGVLRRIGGYNFARTTFFA